MAKVSHMVLPLSDVGRSRDWYVNKRGFQVEGERGAWSASQINRVWWSFCRKPQQRGPKTGL